MKDNAQPARWYMVTKDGAATLCVDREDAEHEAKINDAAWPNNGPHRAVRLVEASFDAHDIATAAAEGYREGAAEMAKLRGQRMVLCSLLGECGGHLQEAANAMYTIEEEMPLWDLVERIESALKAIAEDRVKGGES